MKKVFKFLQNIFLVFGMMVLTWGLVCICRIVNAWTVGLAGAGALMILIGSIGRDDWNA